jgi:hypothetical protein
LVDTRQRVNRQSGDDSSSADARLRQHDLWLVDAYVVDEGSALASRTWSTPDCSGSRHSLQTQTR